MIYCFDIDGTLCSNTEGAYEKAEPYPETIACINILYDNGHKILLFTARGTTTGIDWRQLTEQQLHSWGVKYHGLFFGKPTADIYIDDKCMNVKDWMSKISGSGGNRKEDDRETGAPSILKSSSYLEVTYSPVQVPYGEYPYLLANWILKNIYLKPGRLLDLGCGRGEHLDAFAKLGFEVAGVDISPRAAEIIKQYRVEVADLENDPLPFPPDSFDFVFSKSVIEHMHQPAFLLSKAREALRPGGIAVIMTPSWAHTYWGPFYIDHTHITPFTVPSLSDALTICGFESAVTTYFYQLPFLWKYTFLTPVARFIAAFPLPYRPYRSAPWPEGLNKLIRFSKEVMLLGVGRKKA